MRIMGCIPTECTENVTLNFYRAIHSYGMMSYLRCNPNGLHRSVEKNRNIDLHSVGMQP
ncbi:MAG: hypothetical protein LBN95_04790 [Prevotellaceae bacterium]|jgi:hypothetical protein|nr:hypothetical protein [Prevotellaceae bacterium]